MSWKTADCAATAFYQITRFARSQPGSRTTSPSLIRKASPAISRGESLPTVKSRAPKLQRKYNSQRDRGGPVASLVWAARFLALIWFGYLDTALHGNQFQTNC